MKPKLKFISIIGPKEELERTIDTYIINHEIKIEDALAELKAVKGLTNAEKNNSFSEPYRRLSKMIEIAGLKATDALSISSERALDIEKSLWSLFTDVEEKKAKIVEESAALEEVKSQITPFRGLGVDIQSLLQMKFIKFRFGKIPKPSYRIYEGYLQEKSQVLFFTSFADEKNIWGLYFVSTEFEEKIDAVLSSLHFERFYIPDNLWGTPSEIISDIDERVRVLSEEIELLDKNLRDGLIERKNELEEAYARIRGAYLSYDIRRNVAIRKDEYFIIMGWMTETEAQKLEQEMSKERAVTLVIESPNGAITSKKPSKKATISLCAI